MHKYKAPLHPPFHLVVRNPQQIRTVTSLTSSIHEAKKNTRKQKKRTRYQVDHQNANMQLSFTVATLVFFGTTALAATADVMGWTERDCRGESIGCIGLNENQCCSASHPTLARAAYRANH